MSKDVMRGGCTTVCFSLLAYEVATLPSKRKRRRVKFVHHEAQLCAGTHPNPSTSPSPSAQIYRPLHGFLSKDTTNFKKERINVLPRVAENREESPADAKARSCLDHAG